MGALGTAHWVIDKLRILREADACALGEIGALLRREGPYSSHLSKWRQQRERGELEALAPAKRGPKKESRNPPAQRVAELERENRRLQQRLQQAEVIIEVQKQISTLLGIPPHPGENNNND